MKPQMEGKTDANPEPVKSHQNRNLIAPDVGRKLVFDNIDYRHEVHYMTEEHQNVNNHCVTLMAVENRVSGNHLNNQQPESGVMKLENAFHPVYGNMMKYMASLFWTICICSILYFCKKNCRLQNNRLCFFFTRGIIKNIILSCFNFYESSKWKEQIVFMNICKVK